MKYLSLLLGFFVVLSSCGSEKSKLIDESKNLADSDSLLFVIEGGVSVESLQWEAGHDYELRGRIVNINPAIFQEDNITVGSELIFNLFEDLKLYARVDNANKGPDSVNSYRGEILSPGKATFSMGLEENRILVTIRDRVNKKHFRIYFSDQFAEHIVVEVDATQLDIVPGEAPIRIDSLKNN